MKTITIIGIMVLAFYMQNLNAQTTNDSISSYSEKNKLEELTKEKEEIIKTEKQKLKEEINSIDHLLSEAKISAEEAQNLKTEKAKKAALNIENKTAIIDNKIELLERGEDYDFKYSQNSGIAIGINAQEDNRTLFGIEIKKNSEKNKKYDKRTYSEAVIAFGLNNAIIEGESLNDSPYEIGGSRFFEIGMLLSTRLLKNSNAVRFKYGLSFQFNGLNPKDNMFFVENGDQTALELHPENLKKSKFRMDNLVVPVFFEFGPSTLTEKDDHIRYSTNKKFNFGLGGYAGLNLGARQKLKYKLVDGGWVKDKIKQDYNTNNFVYGLGAYIGYGDMSIYAKYDLNPIFNNALVKQNNISLGLRIEL